MLDESLYDDAIATAEESVGEMARHIPGLTGVVGKYHKEDGVAGIEVVLFNGDEPAGSFNIPNHRVALGRAAVRCTVWTNVMLEEAQRDEGVQTEFPHNDSPEDCRKFMQEFVDFADLPWTVEVEDDPGRGGEHETKRHVRYTFRDAAAGESMGVSCCAHDRGIGTSRVMMGAVAANVVVEFLVDRAAGADPWRMLHLHALTRKLDEELFKKLISTMVVVSGVLGHDRAIEIAQQAAAKAMSRDVIDSFVRVFRDGPQAMSSDARKIEAFEKQ